MSPKHVWSEVGASHQGSTSVSSETLGEPSPVQDKNKKAMAEPLDVDKIRKAGY
jgi:hypothetical protein